MLLLGEAKRRTAPYTEDVQAEPTALMLGLQAGALARTGKTNRPSWQCRKAKSSSGPSRRHPEAVSGRSRALARFVSPSPKVELHPGPQNPRDQNAGHALRTPSVFR